VQTGFGSGKLKKKDTLDDLVVAGRMILKGILNKEAGEPGQINLAFHKVHCWAVVHRVMKLRVT
jgi:hypothetical protein